MIPEFRTLTTKFYWECWRTSEAVLRALALGLGLPNEDYLFKFHTGHENELSLRHYPPLKASLLEKQEMRRLASHTDFDSFTLLFQDDCGGLEVEKKGSPGMYLPVDPIEGAVVMNIGDALMRWSNGEFPCLRIRYKS
jgi:isopenicillin N synthase-like dioxygenase